MKKQIVTFLTIGVIAMNLAVMLMQCESPQKAKREASDDSGNKSTWNSDIRQNADDMLEKGKAVFRFETFGDEAFWTDKLQLHKAIADKGAGGIGDGLSPKAALDAGLKVDIDVLPKFAKEAVAEGKLLNDVDFTLTLLKLNAVVGVVAKFDGNNLKSIGLTCAVCHSTVDSNTGIGKRLDGWPNQDLNVGAIISMAPDLTVFTEMLGTDVETLKKVLASWGPGKFDAELNLDGKAMRPDGKSAATLIPEAFGHAGHNLHTWTGGWGNVTYWNAYVANLELAGNGNFRDARLMNAAQYPIAAKMKFGDKRAKGEDQVSDKLAALQFYQLAIPAPKPPKGSYNEDAANRGKDLFANKAQCATCHVPPLFAEPGLNTHKAEEIGIDDFQANRSPDSTYVTQGLKGIWIRKRGFYHDGRFATLLDVVNHYNNFKKLNLTEPEKNDLVEYMKSL
jgi:mono/diheme cytochrome c family protein